ncbi:hypothetical protein L227DRAFT_65158 [Lentinus tigrinus ALCF2SS1-6]|uniref:Uncharacterized protein n=1 Tax=Lentinus tigrinus ALCF2SS1-6 TaxID=1328759 RepID=A0A5C2SIR9_9APHY|nr:hypothetical protein L227DRAFT_65158 [Lentinus tigrinus ALCF2SS1-6]
MRLMDGRGLGAYVRDRDWLPGSGGLGVRSLSGSMRMELGNIFAWFVFVPDGTFTASVLCLIAYVVVFSSRRGFGMSSILPCFHATSIATYSSLVRALSCAYSPSCRCVRLP